MNSHLPCWSKTGLSGSYVCVRLGPLLGNGLRGSAFLSSSPDPDGAVYSVEGGS